MSRCRQCGKDNCPRKDQMVCKDCFDKIIKGEMQYKPHKDSVGYEYIKQTRAVMRGEALKQFWKTVGGFELNDDFCEEVAEQNDFSFYYETPPHRRAQKYRDETRLKTESQRISEATDITDQVKVKPYHEETS